jgi:hypothetical protein
MSIKFDVHQFHADLQKKGIIFCFSGPVSQDVIEGIGGTLKQKMELEEADLNTTQKVFSIFVEQMQNIVNYSAERVAYDSKEDREIRVGVLIVGQEASRFYVLCGNRIRHEDVQRLRQQLELIQGLNKDELKKLFRDRRKTGTTNVSNRGSGLGFVDIARKASFPIEFDFEPVDQDYVFFTIKAVI